MATRQQVELEGRPLLQNAGGTDSNAQPFEAKTQTFGLNAEIFHRPAFAHVEVQLENRDHNCSHKPVRSNGWMVAWTSALTVMEDALRAVSEAARAIIVA